MAENKNVDQMSPDASPVSMRKSGVRRVNNLPLILAITALALFTSLIAMVAVKRSNNANTAVQQDVAQASKKNTDTSAMAKDVIGEHGAGLIPPERPATPTDEAAGVPIAPVNNPDAPPTPPRQTAGSGAPAAPVDPDEQQIRMAKMQQFQDAVKAKTALSLPNQVGKAGTSPSYGATNDAPQTRE
ncbi:MAG: conjugal transfer protein TrbI, partial [Burkholderiaceae bacterium]